MRTVKGVGAELLPAGSLHPIQPKRLPRVGVLPVDFFIRSLAPTSLQKLEDAIISVYTPTITGLPVNLTNSPLIVPDGVSWVLTRYAFFGLEPDVGSKFRMLQVNDFQAQTSLSFQVNGRTPFRTGYLTQAANLTTPPLRVNGPAFIWDGSGPQEQIPLYVHGRSTINGTYTVGAADFTVSRIGLRIEGFQIATKTLKAKLSEMIEPR